MHVSRRDFLRYCTTSAAALGLSALDLRSLEKALGDSATGRSVIWLQGSSCLGCSMSFLNRIASSAPTTAADALMNSVPLAYHTALMGPSGEMAVATAQKAAAKPFILVVEGGVPTAFDGAACWAWTRSGKDVTFQEVAKDLAARAAAILAVGTCAAYGGIPAAPPNPGEVKNVATATGRPTVNVAGCPAHPDWITWTLVQTLLDKPIDLDDVGRPRELYPETVHDQCPRERKREADSFGTDDSCLERLGCRGSRTRSSCPKHQWNNGVNFCIEANAPCLGCTEPGFPGDIGLYRSVGGRGRGRGGRGRGRGGQGRGQEPAVKG